MSASEQRAQEFLRNLNVILLSYFSLEELKTLCFQVSVNPDDLPAIGRSDKARELVLLMARSGRIDRLITEGKLLRDNVEWPEIPESALFPPDLSQIDHWPKAPFQAPRYDPATFTGRESEQSTVMEYLTSADRSCIVYGMTGVGKTALAKNIAYELRDMFPDGILWSTIPAPQEMQPTLERLAPTLRSFIQAYGRDLGQNTETDLASLSRLMREVLADKRALIVLDDVHDDEELEYLLPPTGKCSVLVTTRNQSLAFVRNIRQVELKSLEQKEAFQLAATLIGSERAMDEKQNILRTIELVDGLPLAVKLIFSYLRQNRSASVAQLNQLLEQQPERIFQRIDRRTVKGVWRSFELGYDVLSSDLQKLLGTLALFPAGHFSVEAVEAIRAEDLAVGIQFDLDELVSFSVIEAIETDPLSDAEQRYRIHGLLRRFVREKLDQESEVAMTPMASFYLDFIHANRTIGFDRLETEWENIAGIVTWAMEAQKWDLLSEIANDLTWIQLGNLGYLDARGYWLFARGLLAKLLEVSEQIADPAAAGVLNLKDGIFSLRLTNYQEAEIRLEDAVANLAKAPQNDRSRLVEAYVCDAKTQLLIQKDIEQALKWSQRGDQLGESFEDSSLGAEEGYLKVRHATTLARSGELDAALELLEQALASLPQRPTAARASGMISLGQIYMLRGQMEQARLVWEEGVVVAEAVGDIQRALALKQNLVLLTVKLGDYAGGIDGSLEILELYEQIRDVEKVGHMCSNVGYIYLQLNKIEEARSYIQRALSIADEHNLKELDVFARVNLANWYASSQEWASASVELDRAEAMANDIGLTRSQGDIDELRARIPRTSK